MAGEQHGRAWSQGMLPARCCDAMAATLTWRWLCSRPHGHHNCGWHCGRHCGQRHCGQGHCGQGLGAGPLGLQEGARHGLCKGLACVRHRPHRAPPPCAGLGARCCAPHGTAHSAVHHEHLVQLITRDSPRMAAVDRIQHRPVDLGCDRIQHRAQGPTTCTTCTICTSTIDGPSAGPDDSPLAPSTQGGPPAGAGARRGPRGRHMKGPWGVGA